MKQSKRYSHFFAANRDDCKPDGRQVQYRYGTTPVTATRVEGVTNGTTDYENYTFFGLSTVVTVKRPGVTGGMQLQLWKGGTNLGDRFGRTSDTKWTNSSGSTVFDWFSYGYDRNSNELWRKNNLATGHAFDELYQPVGVDPASGYDGLDRLKAFERGKIIGAQNNQIDGAASASQSWSLDTQDNWSSVTTSGNPEGRDHNAANEITQVESGGDATAILYDNAGTFALKTTPINDDECV
jgi:hypothetical protein